MLSTDDSQSLYDARAPGLFKKYGGAEWPSIVLPGGFEGALQFGDFGYGKIIVDADGIVRSIGEYKMKPTLKTLFPDSN